MALGGCGKRRTIIRRTERIEFDEQNEIERQLKDHSEERGEAQERYRADAKIVLNRRKDGAGQTQNVLDRRGTNGRPSAGSEAGQLTVDAVEEGRGRHTLFASWLQFLYRQPFVGASDEQLVLSYIDSPGLL